MEQRAKQHRETPQTFAMSFCMHTWNSCINQFNRIAVPRGRSVNRNESVSAASSLQHCMLHGYIPSGVRKDTSCEPEIKQNILTVPA